MLLHSVAELWEAGPLTYLLPFLPRPLSDSESRVEGNSWHLEGITGAGVVALVPELSKPGLPHSISKLGVPCTHVEEPEYLAKLN